MDKHTTSLLKASIAVEQNKKLLSDSAEDVIARARMIQSGARDAAKELRGSVVMQQMAKQIVSLECQVRDLRNLLEPFVQQFECIFDNDENCKSVEIAQNYVDAATYLRDNFNRKYDRIADVQNWINNYLPY